MARASRCEPGLSARSTSRLRAGGEGIKHFTREPWRLPETSPRWWSLMSSTVSDEQAAGVSRRGGGGGRRQWVAVLVVIVLIAAAAVAVAVSGVFKPTSSGTGASQYRASTRVVTRRSPPSQINLSATLGD